MEIRTQIETALAELEEQEDIRIVYACESGSRAWGFESRDSDYDVRFLYLHPARRYLGISQVRDVVERALSSNLDISGWDLRKALQLLRKSNPPLLEWLQSPIVYRQIPSVVSRIHALVPQYYSPAACHYHYLHMATKNYREYLRGEQVWIKKYFYVLRPVLACLWIERGLGLVPIEFSKLVNGVVDSTEVRQAIQALLRRKRAGEELSRGPRDPIISDFLDKEISRLSAVAAPPSKPTTVQALDQLFIASLVDVYGDLIEARAASDSDMPLL